MLPKTVPLPTAKSALVVDFFEDEFHSCLTDCGNHNIDCEFHFFERRNGRRNADIAVEVVEFVGEGCACRRELDARACRDFDDTFCAGFDVNGNEVTAAGSRPFHEFVAFECFGELSVKQFELRTEKVCVLCHNLLDVFGVFEEVGVHNLVDFVCVDALEEHQFENVFDVLFGRGYRRNTATRKRDFGRGRERVNAVHCARFARDVEYVFELVAGFVEVVNHVSVVPEHAEIACRDLHRGDAFDHAVRERDARGVGVLGYAPHTFDCVVFSDERFDDVHIGTVFFHCDGYHFDAELLADGEVTVITGCGANELDLFEVVPRGAAEHAELFCEMYEGVHKVKAAAVADENFFGSDAEKFRKQVFAGFGAAECAVVSCVDVFRRIIVSARFTEHGHGNFELRFGGSAARHINASALFDELLKALLFFGKQGFEFFFGERFVIHKTLLL